MWVGRLGAATWERDSTRSRGAKGDFRAKGEPAGGLCEDGGRNGEGESTLIRGGSHFWVQEKHRVSSPAR